MRILLIGEYNRSHWNIKEGLNTLGFEAITFGMQDGFKKVDVDIKIKNPFSNFLLHKLRILALKLFDIDLFGTYVNYVINSKKKKLSGFDVIQFISESPFNINNKSQLRALKYLIKWNKKAFILSSGKDYISVSYAYDKKLRYSILTPYFENNGLRKKYFHTLCYLNEDYIQLHNYVFSKIEGVIANDFDYHLPLKKHPKYLGLIPHAIDLSKIAFNTKKIEDEIIIFHGINKDNYYMKGNFIFEKALGIIEQKYLSKVKIIAVSNLPYKEYIKKLNSCHILLDQTYSYDLGYNALEAMAMGKVVFSGAEQEWLEHYNIEEDTVVINALPDVNNIVEKLEWLINNPNKIIEISQNARAFVELHHDHIKCAQQYLKKWG